MSDPPRPDLGNRLPPGAGTPPIPPPPERRRSSWVGIVGLVVGLALVGGAVVWAVTGEPRSSSMSPSELLAIAPAQAASAGCGTIVDVGPYLPVERDVIHVDAGNPPPLSSWPSVPPASGPHDPRPLHAGYYDAPPPILSAIHSLEHGAVIVWYAPSTPKVDLAGIARFYRDPVVGGHVIVAPYDYPDQGQAGRLPAGESMALVAWHRLQLCADVNLAAAFGFSAYLATPTFRDRPYLGEAPEPGAAI